MSEEHIFEYVLLTYELQEHQFTVTTG